MPRFSVRRLLVIITALSLFFLVLSFAARGEHWAIALASVGGSLALSFVFFALFFQLAFVWANISGTAARRAKSQSPFAHEAPPPRYVAPTDPE